MKKEDFYELLSDIDADALKAAEDPPAKKPKFVWLKYAVPAAACIALFVGIGVLHNYPDTGIQTDMDSTSLSEISTYTSPTVSTETFTSPTYPSETDVTSSASVTDAETSAPTETISTAAASEETVTVPPEPTETVTVPPKPTETAARLIALY